jgi:hypothetical protein
VIIKIAGREKIVEKAIEPAYRNASFFKKLCTVFLKIFHPLIKTSFIV